MAEWANVVVVALIAAFGWAVTFGTLRESVKNHGKWLEAMATTNRADHEKLNKRIDDETLARAEGYSDIADSVANNYVRKDYCGLMHAKEPTNGSAKRERA